MNIIAMLGYLCAMTAGAFAAKYDGWRIYAIMFLMLASGYIARAA